MSAGGNKLKLTYEEVRNQYLEAGRKYSSLLRDAMKLDPNIIKIAEEIMITGDKISVHDNKLLTRFYNELREGSKIDKKYYELLIELKRAKNDLDIATDHLLSKRIGKILIGAGIPPRDANLSDIACIGHINNPDSNLLEKISLPGVLPIELATELDQLVTNGDLRIVSGKFVSETKGAREFIKRLEREVRKSVNDSYLLGFDKDHSLGLADFHRPGSVVELIKMAADEDHIREIERRIDAGDVRFINGELTAMNDKGKKYLKLLSEELFTNLDRKIDAELLSRNQKYINHDARLFQSKKAVDTLRKTVNKHDHFAGLVNETVYNELLGKMKKHQETVEAKMSRLMTEIETISRAFLNIKKRLMAVVSKSEVDVEGLISILVASRHLSRFEADYERDLSGLEHLLGVKSANSGLGLGPVTPDQLAEDCCQSDCVHFEEANNLIKNLVADRMKNRKCLGGQMDKALADFVLSPTEVDSYRSLLCAEEAVRRHIGDVNYCEGSLYQGIGDLSYLIEELVELEVEKRDKIADIIHEFELTHKELWLANIKRNNKDFISNNFPDLPSDIRDRAVESNERLVGTVREYIKGVIEKYRDEHKASSDSFGKELKLRLDELKKGGDVATVSTKLKNEYKKMLASHDQALKALETEIKIVERKMDDFEVSSKSSLEKVLLDDIRKSI